ncbi:sortase [Patescibacteria group bacterium]|nr:sortase [Patescibacteria group bacterium]MBU0776779.1 sortase [Patescibacteria group bacterium]MBU0846352.1 sortase [Patescibacteria group bacterium]MBU0922688.1 sortase [Patescibacteria group bacterium]MBU1066739.1 sortase [Patescibacteria group bacterium]
MDNKLLRIAAIISGISGIVILFSVVLPIVSYQSISNQKYPSLLSPIVQSTSKVTLEEVDYTKASNWFIDNKDTSFSTSSISHYVISISKLGIKKATVTIGGEDLSGSLVQYPGTALPGKNGNAVIFGHSILPQFYDPEDYLSIFSTLPTLDEGDEIQLDYDGVVYKYIVEKMFEVLPSDIGVLEQDKSDSFLTLVTCVPPGHPLKPKRLIIRARIVPIEQANANISN